MLMIDAEMEVGMQGFGTIVIVDDDELARRQLSQTLSSCGVKIDTVIECENGKDALEFLHRNHADLVFTDIQMPMINGFDMIRELNGMMQKPLVVVVTKYNYFSYAVEMLRLGVKDYLLKPVGREKLAGVMQRILEEESRIIELQKSSAQIHTARLQEFMLKGEDSELAVSGSEVEYELLDTTYRVVCCYSEGRKLELSYLLYLWDDKGQDIFILNEEAWEQQKADFDCWVYGVSELHEKTGQLHQAYTEAWESRKKKYFSRHSKIRNDSLQYRGEREVPDIHVIEQAVNMIGTDKLEEAVRLIDGLIYMTSMGQCQIQLFEELMNYFVLSVSNIYQNVLKEADMNVESIRHIYCFQDCRVYREKLTEWINSLNRVIENRFGDYKNKQKIQQALHYIHENYNKNLNMAVVTNYISMNYSLFSYTFKQYTGQNFVDYLKNLRVNEAKKLLTETDMLIMDISRAVGYDNEKHFTKVFKAECGVSPSEYRKNTLYRK